MAFMKIAKYEKVFGFFQSIGKTAFDARDIMSASLRGEVENISRSYIRLIEEDIDNLKKYLDEEGK